MPKKLTYEQVKAYIETNGYVVVSREYVNSNEKLSLICSNEHSCSISYGKFQSGRRCPICSNRVKIKKEDVEIVLKKLNYRLLSDFQNSNVPILVECPYGHEWSVTYQKFKLGRRCTKCVGDQRTGKGNVLWDIEMIRNYLSQENYTLISKEYSTARDKLIVNCDNDHQTEIYWSHFIRGVRCRECNYDTQSKNQRMSTEDVDKILTGIGYKRKSQYVNSHKNMTVVCDKGHLTSMCLSNLITGVRCKYCKKKSKGEAIINSYLKSKEVTFDREVRKSIVENGKTKYMSFDFGIFNGDREHIAFIEFDGIQHFKTVSFFREGLEVIKERDQRKNDYCKNENIPLLRIPYTRLKESDVLINDFLKITN